MTVVLLALLVFLATTTGWAVLLKREQPTAVVFPDAAIFGAMSTFGAVFLALALWVFVTVFHTIIVY